MPTTNLKALVVKIPCPLRAGRAFATLRRARILAISLRQYTPGNSCANFYGTKNALASIRKWWSAGEKSMVGAHVLITSAVCSDGSGLLL